MEQGQPFSLTYPQREIWETEMWQPHTNLHVMALTLEFQEQLEYHLLNQAINRLRYEHDALRIQLKQQANTEPLQYIVPYREEQIDFVDFHSPTGSTEELETWVHSQVQTPFSLFDANLNYSALLKKSEQQSMLFLKMHHITLDGISVVNLLMNQLIATYLRLRRGEELPPLKRSTYLQFVENEKTYLQSDRYRKDELFWQQEFRTMPDEINLKANDGVAQNTQAARESRIIPVELQKQLQNFCQQYNCSCFALFAAVLQLWLAHTFSIWNIVIGANYSNRTTRTEKEIVGLLVNTVPLRMGIDPNEGFFTFLRQFIHKKWCVLRHQKYPYAQLLQKLKEEQRDVEKLFTINLDYRPVQWMGWQELPFLYKWHFNGHEVNTIAIQIEDFQEAQTTLFSVDYRELYFSQKEIAEMITDMFGLLKRALEHPNQRIKELMKEIA